MLIVSLCCLDDYCPEWKNQGVDLLEIRLDLLSDSDRAKLPFISLNLPFILTLKGNLNWSYLALLKPDYVDLDYTRYEACHSLVQNLWPQAKLIVSRHTPHFYVQKKYFKKYPKADFKKLVIESENPFVALNLALRAQKERLLLFASGRKTSFSRLFSPWQYTYASTPTGVGQLSIEEALNLYRWQKPLDSFYALIGNPVDKSPSHLTHNRFFHKTLPNLCYIKVPLSHKSLSKALVLLKKLGCQGLSITTPFKEAITPLLNPPAPIKTINTLCFKTFRVTNTDRLALLEWMNLCSKGSVLVLGSGACARYFLEFLKTESLILWQWSRKTGFQALAHHQPFPKKFDIIINATSSGNPLVPLPLCSTLINLYHHQDEAPLELEARRHHARVCRGLDFFMSQAFHQFLFWFPTLNSEDQNRFFSLGKDLHLRVD